MRFAILFYMLFVFSCAKNSFEGSANVQRKAPPSLPPEIKPKDEPKDPSCIDNILPIRLILVLDITTSMAPNLNVVSQNVMTFASSLEAVKFPGANGKVPVTIGMVTFTDRIFNKVDLTDPFAFAGSVRGLSVQDDNNIDFPEGGMLAVKMAAEMLKREEEQNGAGIPIIVVVTDALAHDGAGSPNFRSCDLRALSGLGTIPQLKRLALYDSSPSATLGEDQFGDQSAIPQEIAQCAPYSGVAGGGPALQWSEFRSRELKNRAGSGSALGFPFNAQALLSTLPRDLETTYKVCK